MGQLETLKSMGVGYRTENYSGSNVRSLKEVLEFEIGELCNFDVLDYLDDNYGTQFNIADADEMVDMGREKCEALANEAFEFLNEKFGQAAWFALWLTTKERVREYYCYEGEEPEIDKYVIQDDWIAISDLGEDGVLFMMKTFPQPVAA